MLRELDRLCTQEIPLPEDFVLISKDKSVGRRTFLGYSYASRADYKAVKDFYKAYFARNGWVLTGQREGGWGSDYLEFKKDYFIVKVYHGGMGDADYALHCEKLLDSGEGRRNIGVSLTHNHVASHLQVVSGRITMGAVHITRH